METNCPKLGDARDHTVERAGRYGMPTRWRESADGFVVQVGFRNGRDICWVGITEIRAKALNYQAFETITFLGGYDAIFCDLHGTIESLFSPVESRPSLYDPRSLTDALRFTPYTPSEQLLITEIELPEDELTQGLHLRRPPRIETEPIRLDIRGPSGLRITISPATETFTAIAPRRMGRAIPLTLKISGIAASRHDDALALLEQISDSLFFQFDLVYDIPLRLRRRLRTIPQSRRIRLDENTPDPTIPRARYEHDPITLYFYARGSTEAPLLEFLAYYQTLEYFFPRYTHEERLRNLKQELMDPRFNANDPSHLTRIISIVGSRNGWGVGTEREQLKATLRGCLTLDRMEEFITADADRCVHYGSPVIKSVSRINLKNKQVDLREQVADRVYDIRCRIVHTKDGGQNSSPPILLPFGTETSSIRPDIELVRFLAQNVMIASSEKPPWIS